MLLKNPSLREGLMNTVTQQELYDVLLEYDNHLDE
jgi:hypothetical protein